MDYKQLLFQVRQFFSYWNNAKTKFQVHSPFVFQFILKVLEIQDITYQLPNDLKKYIKQNDAKLVKSKLGAGSKASNSVNQKASKLTKHIGTKPKYGKVLTRLSNHIKAEYILELGSGLGMGTAYLSSGEKVKQVISIEGNEAFFTYNQNSFNTLKEDKVEFVNGMLEDELENALERMERVDLIFVDGNHTLAATLSYFKTIQQYAHENTVVVFDDIYWSEEMKKAWETIIKNEKVTLSIDIFQFGMVFLQNKRKEKEHFVLWY